MAENDLTVDQNLDAPLPPSPSGLQAIDFEESYRAINAGLQYVNESRVDFEHDGPQKWISDLATLLASTAQQIREFELAHDDDTVLWRDENGAPHEILVRLQDEKRFDRVMKDYVTATEQFEHYFKQHALLVKGQRK